MNEKTLSTEATSAFGLVLLACSSDKPASAPRDEAGRSAPARDAGASAIVIMADSRFPAATLTDWVSFAEQLSVVTVLREEELPPPPEVVQRGEGYIGRRVLLRVDSTIWNDTRVTPADGEIQMVVLGWILSGGRRHVAQTRDAARIEVSGRYVIPLLRYATGWGPLTSGSAFAADRDEVATGDIMRCGQSETARALSTKTHSEVREALEAAPRDPIVEMYRHLPPEERLAATQRHTGP